MASHMILLKEQFKGLIRKNLRTGGRFRNFAIGETYFYKETGKIPEATGKKKSQCRNTGLRKLQL